MLYFPLNLLSDLLEPQCQKAYLQNYMYMRNQKVFVNGTFLSLKVILVGVPQGSVLGPLFFLIYIKDLADYLHGMARLFADDNL